MALIRKIFWVALFLVSTFGFVVLFDYGPTGYMNSVKIEYANLQKFINWKPQPKKDESDKAPPK